MTRMMTHNDKCTYYGIYARTYKTKASGKGHHVFPAALLDTPGTLVRHHISDTKYNIATCWFTGFLF